MSKIKDWSLEHPFEKLVNEKAENPFQTGKVSSRGIQNSFEDKDFMRNPFGDNYPLGYIPE